MSGLTGTLSDADVDRIFGCLKDDKRIALAVSGGGDSMALLCLANAWAARHGIALTVLTVDHGLRPESVDEACRVAKWCAALGVPHQLLRWHHAEVAGNLPQAGREARYRLMADHCVDAGIDVLATGHTRDDQAETVLMRLARGSGVDGLSAMALETMQWGVRIVRPLLDLPRGMLRDVLRDCDQAWIEDPTNDDSTYDRIKARRALETLAPLGVSPERLVRTARMMGLAREVLDTQARLLIQKAVSISPIGYSTVDPALLGAAPRETALRSLAELLRGIAGSAHRPRLDPLEGLLDWAICGEDRARTLHGCLLRRKQDEILIMREPKACVNASQRRESGAIWDNRFKIASAPQGYRIAALSEGGLEQIPSKLDSFSKAWSESPREARLTTPALWQDDKLVSAPFAPWALRDAPEWQAAAIQHPFCEDTSEMVE